MIYNFFVFPAWVVQGKAIPPMNVQKNPKQMALKSADHFLTNRNGNSSKWRDEEWIHITVQEWSYQPGVPYVKISHSDHELTFYNMRMDKLTATRKKIQTRKIDQANLN